jgi:DNA-binding NarL/FixJ family response regulator
VAERPITVALVDDQPLFRSGIRMLVQSQADMDMAWEADDGEEAVALAAKQRPDVMLMDLRMPVMDGSRPRGASRKKPMQREWTSRRSLP